MRVTLFDYGAGNLHSLAKALETPGVTLAIKADPAAATQTDLLVLPGVGAFGPAAAALAPARDRMRDAIAGGLPCVGICLGMQLLFDRSEEGDGLGLGVIPGAVRRLRTRRQPHMGWNAIEPQGEQPLLAASGLRTAYFAHSFVCEPDDPAAVAAWTQHDDDRFASIVRAGSALGVQFHPEKSSGGGVALLRAVLAAARAGVA
jgi:imidazole glycerol-phosphate synthase subunit HisH